MVKIASCQLTPASEIQARKAQINDILLKCETENMDFICFPEGFLTGYYAQENLARKHSLEVGEAAFAEWLELFRISTATIIVGFNEREGSHIFDSAAIVENGKLLGVQRKHYLYHDYFTPGTSFSPFSSKGITFGVVICLDTNYFEPARLLALKGATILFSPMCNRVTLDHPYAKRPPYYSQFVARSHENRCWLIAADWVLPSDGESICSGHSSIYDPDGREMARSREGHEDILVIDIPKERLFEDKGRRVHGSQSLAQELHSRSFNINTINQAVACRIHNQFNIRPLQLQDIEALGDLYFPWSTREETVAKWTGYLDEQQKGARMTCIVEQQGKIVGYGNLLRSSEYPHFKQNKIPEINDVWVYEESRKKGIATALIAHFEQLAKQESYTAIGIGVGLYRDYGTAQRLYFRLGYQPDGEGITYKHAAVVPGEKYAVDDDLILWLTKRLVAHE